MKSLPRVLKDLDKKGLENKIERPVLIIVDDMTGNSELANY
jgi:hypothetical protein